MHVHQAYMYKKSLTVVQANKKPSRPSKTTIEPRQLQQVCEEDAKGGGGGEGGDKKHNSNLHDVNININGHGFDIMIPTNPKPNKAVIKAEIT